MSSAPLILVPTRDELARLRECWPGIDGSRLERCGVGPVAAAARAAALLAVERPSEVLLVGIAGTYDEGLAPPGSAHVVEAVVLDGLGAGEGDAFRPLRDLGFPQWDPPGGEPIHERIDLGPGGPGASTAADARRALLVTVLATSATAEEAERRLRRYPGALLEDMEGFGVALACRLGGVPARIVRGVSNRAGDRDHGRWLVDEALAAAADLVRDEARTAGKKRGPSASEAGPDGPSIDATTVRGEGT